MSAWGTGPWGTGAWGTNSPIPIPPLFYGIVYMAAVSERELLVELALPPLQESPLGAGDALNRSTWAVDVDGQPLLVLDVYRVSSTVFKLATLPLFPSGLLQMTAGAPALRDQLGGLISPAVTGVLNGCEWLRQGSTRVGMLDFENPPFDDGGPGGEMRIGAAGDYRLHGGVPFLRKLIMRRLTTSKGGLFHLTDYGVGLRGQEILTGTDLQRIRVEIDRQLSREPEFLAVQSRVTLYADGRLHVEVRVKLRNNEQVLVPLDILRQAA